MAGVAKFPVFPALIPIVLILGYILVFVGRRPKGCPPGPPTLPVIGNLHQLPKKDIHLAYQAWGQKYGRIFSLQLGQQTVIVLTSGEMVKQLIDRKSSNFSDRPSLYMQEVWEYSRIIMRRYDALWKVERKLYHLFLNSSIVHNYAPYQSLETKRLCVDLLDNNPSLFFDHIGRATSSVATSMTYGTRISSPDAQILKTLNETAGGFFQLVNGSQFFDWYPSLRAIGRKLPLFLNPWARKGTAVYQKERAHFRQLFEETRDRLDCSDALPSFVSDICHAQKTWKDTSLLTDHAASYIAGIAFEAGSDTQRSSLISFFKAMALFPEAQRLAQKEIDDVLGETYPEYEHYSRLPYIRCVVKEVLRWMPAAINGGIPHASRDADEIDGYKIPAGATVVLAVWSCNNDELQFDDPRVFNPGRHNPDLSAGQAAVARDVKDRDSWAFGAGRRICPGLHLAEATLFLAIARVLWTFNISHAKDSSGAEIPIEIDAVTQSIVATPLPFQCEILARTEKRAQAVRDAWKAAEELLDSNGNYNVNILK